MVKIVKMVRVKKVWSKVKKFFRSKKEKLASTKKRAKDQLRVTDRPSTDTCNQPIINDNIARLESELNEELENLTPTTYSKVHQEAQAKAQDKYTVLENSPSSSSSARAELSSKSCLGDGKYTNDDSTHFPYYSSSSSCYHSATDSEEDCIDENFEGIVHLSLVEWQRDRHLIWGCVKARNFTREFEKKPQVFVRWTSDKWSTYNDTFGVTKASGDDKLQNYKRCNTYTFEIPVPDCAAESVELAVAYKVDGNIYWDNNGYRNYNIGTMYSMLRSHYSGSVQVPQSGGEQVTV